MYSTVHLLKLFLMANTTQVTATLPDELIAWIEKQPERGMISFSKTIAVLLKEARAYRETGRKSKKNLLAKYSK